MLPALVQAGVSFCDQFTGIRVEPTKEQLMAAKKKRKHRKKAVCGSTLDRVLEVVTSPIVLNAAISLVQALRTGGKA